MINCKKIITKCQNIAQKEDVELRQIYKRTVKELSVIQRFKRIKGGDLKARKASKKIKTIAGRLVRDLERKLDPLQLQNHEIDFACYLIVK
jgi:IS5 family transposase